MYDAVDASRIPRGVGLVAGYVDGAYRWASSDWDLFPDAVWVGIAVAAGTNLGEVLDVERGDATPDQAPGWVKRRRDNGIDPTVYCSEALWADCRAAFAGAGVAEPHWWIASWPGGGPTVPAGAVAHQYLHPGPVDVSVVADYWPGIDPAPASLPPPIGPGAVTFDEEPEMLVFVSFQQQHTVTVDPGGELVHRFYTVPGPGRPGGWVREVRAAGCIPGAPVGFDPDFAGQLHLYADLVDSGQVHCFYTPTAGWVTERLD
jgi:hypothetical protein